MTFNQLVAAILAILPEASFGEDNDGQIVIYTNLHQSSVSNDDPLVPIDLSNEG